MQSEMSTARPAASVGDHKLETLEMLRAVAALTVVLFHTQFVFWNTAGFTPFEGIFAAGDRGVDLFFVLSGFIMVFIYQFSGRRSASILEYAAKRIGRIYPLVWIMTAFAISTYALGFGGADKAAKLSSSSIVTGLMLLPHQGPALVNVSWSLKYEMFFYCLFGVSLYRRRLGYALIATWQAAILIKMVVGKSFGLLDFYFDPVCLDFGIGMVCAGVVRSRLFSEELDRRLSLSLVAGVGLFVAGMLARRYNLLSSLSCALASGIVIVCLVRLERLGRARVYLPLLKVGRASYAIYMVHYSVITLAAHALVRTGMAMTSVVALGVAVFGISIGYLADRWIDHPLQKCLRVDLRNGWGRASRLSKRPSQCERSGAL